MVCYPSGVFVFMITKSVEECTDFAGLLRVDGKPHIDILVIQSEYGLYQIGLKLGLSGLCIFVTESLGTDQECHHASGPLKVVVYEGYDAEKLTK